ncbi:MAG: ATP-binding cassette domain-containing protein, partial [Candidatus Omnitrophica bacterium]|nr:ATP-binding cassette domain-containing protein [Candidatus Omnitrophota bacterium]
MNEFGVPLISTFGLKKDYDSLAGKLSVLKGVEFSMNHGEMVLIHGRSVSGKSTLLHLLGGLEQATSGKVIFEGRDITSLSERELARIRNRRIGYVFQ